MIVHNRYFVSERGGKLYILTTPGGMDRDQALNLAAWLVAMSRSLPGDTEFGDVIEAVEAT